MIIKVDEDGAKIIQSLCDLALKSGGIQNFKMIAEVLNSVKIEEEIPETKTKSKKG